MDNVNPAINRDERADRRNRRNMEDALQRALVALEGGIQAQRDEPLQLRTNEHGREDQRRAAITAKEIKVGAIKQTDRCDGTSTASIRKWLNDMDMAIPVVGAQGIVAVISHTVGGPLRAEVERYIATQAAFAAPIARAAIPWEDLRTYLVLTF